MSKNVSYLTQIARCSGLHCNRQTEPLGISARQSSLLLEICATPNISQDTLAKRVFLNKSVVARLLANLEEQGFVGRPVSQTDKRTVCLHPTEKALQIAPQLGEINAKWAAFLTSDMTEEEIETLESLLSRLQTRAADWSEVAE